MPDYDQDYKGVQGLNYPENGKKLFQEDLQEEQFGIGEEILQRERDYFTAGIISGFDVFSSSIPGCVNISSGKGRDDDGRRISLSATNDFLIPDGQTVKIIVRHLWDFENYVPDGGSENKTRRNHSAEITCIPVSQELTNRELALRQVSRSGSTVTLGDDLRINISFQVNGVNLSDGVASLSGIMQSHFSVVGEITTICHLNVGGEASFDNLHAGQILKHAESDYLLLEGVQFADGSIKLNSGATINEFSTDGTMAGNSDTAVPTEKAVKTYADGLDAENVKKTGNQAVAGIKTFGSIPVLPASNPSSDNQAVRKKYVDEEIVRVSKAVIHPIGTPYIQFPGLPDPITLFGTDWVVVDYQEAFFRAQGSGSDADPFLTAYNASVNHPQSHQLQGHWHETWFNNTEGGSGSIGDHLGKSATVKDYTNSRVRNVISDGAHGSVSVGNQTRPISFTIILWERKEI